MKRVYFGNLGYPFAILPYHWGILRAFAEVDPTVREAYRFERPLMSVGSMRSPAEGRQKLLAELEKIEEPAVFATSNYVWNFQFHMGLARLVKEKYPDCLVIAGGPHIPDEPLDFFERYPYVDVLVHGEGELPFRELLKENLKAAPRFEAVPNISWNVGGRAVTSDARATLPKWLTETELPSPYLLGYFDDLVGELRAVARGQDVWTLWETNRGCPYPCTFCEWGVAAVNRLKRFDTDRLHRELRRIAELEIDHLFCADANFGILERDVELARAIAGHRAARGYPKFFTTNFAKNSNDYVFEISRELARYGMIKGTTLAMQSVDGTVLEAIKRQTIGIANYQALKRRYDEAGIPTYVDLILGLPKESLQSFRTGMCKLLETGHHEDIRVFSLELLPNTPMVKERSKYALKTILKKSYPFDDIPSTEVVYGSDTMSPEDWRACRIFADIFIAALHSGGYSRFLATFLHEQGRLSYERFYVGLADWVRSAPDTVIGRLVAQYDSILSAFLAPGSKIDALYYSLLAAHPDVKAQLRPYLDREKKRAVTNAHEWAWLALNGAREQLYSDLRRFLSETTDVDPGTELLEDLFRFQGDLILSPDYDPELGKTANYVHDWPAYFFGEGVLHRCDTVVRYADVAMGSAGQHLLKKGSLPDFALAAVGNYYPDGKWNRFFHQPAKMKWERLGTEAPIVARRPEMRIEPDRVAERKATRRAELKLRLID